MNTPAHEAALALAADLLDSDQDAALDGEELLTFAGMRTYADVCGRMRTYADADVCGRMWTYADVCGRMRTYADVC